MQRVAELVGGIVRSLEREAVRLDDACGRFVAGDVLAPHDLPAVDEALRDGFAIRGEGEPHAEKLRYPVTGEIAAGDQGDVALSDGNAARIFTGAQIPEGTDRVISQEHCSERDGMVGIPTDLAVSGRRHIKAMGSELTRGTLLVRKGQCLQPHHLALLANAGLSRVELFRQPQVACFSTGSELVGVGTRAELGQKVSSNCLFLRHRLAQYGAQVVGSGLIPDRKGALGKRLQEAVKQGVDLFVTTGGMGPGKYDLVAEDFIAAGGTIHCSSLPVRPGKSLLVGSLGTTVLIALPGPPTAVEVLADILVGPALYAMQGRPMWPQPVEARLVNNLRRHHPAGIDQLGPAQLVHASGNCLVRTLAGPEESGNCYLLFPGEKAELLEGEMVTIYLPLCSER